MSVSSPPTRSGRASRWTTSSRSPSPEDAARIQALLERPVPRFWAAVVADARITARYRGEHARFRSSFEALGQVVRLAWVTDSFLAQVCYRAKVSCRARRIPVLPAVLHRLSIVLGQVSIGDKAVISPGVYLPHGQVVVDGLTFVGAGVVLRPFVTLGLRDGFIFGPNIGDRTCIGTGAKVFGPCRIGSDVQIGANAVVTGDLPDGVTAVGVPARVTATRASD